MEHMGPQPSKRPGQSLSSLGDQPQLMPPKQLTAIQKPSWELVRPENGWPNLLQPPILEIKNPV